MKDSIPVDGIMIASPTSPPRAKKRHRVDIACNTCKARKVKCDGIRPVCGQCAKRRGGLGTCVYRQDAGISASDPGLNREHSPVHPSVSSIVDFGASGLAAPTPTSVSWTPGTQSSRRVSFGRQNFAPPAPAPAAAVPAPPANDELLPSDNLVGASIDANFLRQIKNAMNSGNRSTSQREELYTSKPDKVLPRLPPTPGEENDEDMRFVLPTRTTADHLMQLYWDYVATIFPWLERPVIEAAYERLWSNDTSGSASMNKQAFHCILNLIFATACGNGPSSGKSELQCLHSAEMFFRRAEELMSFNLMKIHHLEMVQIMLISAVHLQAANKSEQFCDSINLAISIAQNLGLHRPGTIEALASPSDRELARRLWHGCIIMDKLAAMTFGCMLKIPQDLAAQIEYPRSLGSQDPTLPIRPDQPPADLDFYVAFCRLHHVLGNVLKAFYKASARGFGAFTKIKANSVLTSDVLADLFRIESELCDWQANLKDHLQPPSNRQDQIDAACSMRQSNILHARYLCVRLLLFRPFFFLDRNISDNDNGSQTPSRVPLDEQVMGTVVNDCRVKCIHAARDIIELILNNPSNQFRASGISTLPSHWYIISYIYMAATVLIAAQMFPKVSDRVSISQLGSPLQQAYRILQDCEPYTDVARKCRVALTFLHDAILSRNGGTNGTQSSHDISTGTDANQTAPVTPNTIGNVGDPLGGIFELGKEDLGDIAGWPLYWNEWPLAFFPVENSGNGSDFI